MEFITYDSLEDMQAALAEADAAAFAAMSPTQAALGHGDYWMRPAPEYDTVIFGYCVTEDEIRKSELDAGATASEAEECTRGIVENVERGYLYGKAYSTICPEGEWGSTHKSTAWPITEEQYRDAEAHGWQFHTLPWVAEVTMAALREFRS